ncbi:MAG TPA: M28 family peptidase [Mycobacterium sp.]|nr:M28 family peptidase [Mycobacterium sp.]
MRRAVVGVLLVTALVSCSSKPAATPADLARDLASKIKVDAVVQHLQRLQDIANTNNGTRADGTPGYQASVDYVVKTLSNKGFDVQTPEASRVTLEKQGTQALTVGEQTFEIVQASLLVQTPPGGLTATAVHAAKRTGCASGDYSGTAVKGAIAVTDDTGCSVADKQKAAVAHGAVALLVMSARGDQGAPPGLFTPGYYKELTVPVGVIGAEADAALWHTTAPVRLSLESKSVETKTRNVVAQTKTGSSQDVVVVGAHLVSFRGSPGINDDGSGVAAVLETAVQLGSSPSIQNAVRFCFWAAEEQGVTGSTQYVTGLPRDQLNDVALYLNFDLLGSPNAGYFTYDGDQSGPPSQDVPPDKVAVGSAGIERTLSGYLNLAGRRPADQPLGGAADYYPFLTAGVPLGGITTGSSAKKTQVQARLWGGTAGQPFDPNYHTGADTVDKVNRDALSVTAPAVAFAVGTYAQSIDGPNGVPSHDQRHR